MSELENQIAEFCKERNEALLSLDEQKIRTMVRKWNNIEMPADMNIFWGSVRKAITGCNALPLEFRKASKAYLDEHGLRNFSDGDL